MSTRTRVPAARSFRQGQVAVDELVELVRGFRDDRVRADILDQLEDLESYATDAIVLDGDVVVNGDLDTGDTGFSEDGDTEGTLLIIKGDLTVQGLYRDACNDAPDFVLIKGSLRAHDVVTASFLEVGGDLIASGSVVGDYNDGHANIAGDLEARLFAPLDHAFRIGGALRAEFFVGPANRCEARSLPAPLAWRDVPLAHGIDADNPRLARLLRDHQSILR